MEVEAVIASAMVEEAVMVSVEAVMVLDSVMLDIMVEFIGI